MELKFRKVFSTPSAPIRNFVPVGNKGRLVSHLLVLGAWAIIQYVYGNTFGLLCIAVFALLVTMRTSNYLLLAGTVLVAVLFITPTTDTLVKLIWSNAGAVKRIKPLLANIFQPNSGQEVLSKQVRRMLNLMQNHHVVSYRLSNKLSANMYIKQRITEAAWPRKMDDAAPYILSTIKEIQTNQECETIDKQEDIVLVYCP